MSLLTASSALSGCSELDRTPVSELQGSLHMPTPTPMPAPVPVQHQATVSSGPTPAVGQPKGLTDTEKRQTQTHPRIYVSPGKEIGDRLVLYSEKLSIIGRYLEALQDALPPQEPAMFWFHDTGLRIVVNVPSEYRYHMLFFHKSFFSTYECKVPGGFRTIINVNGFLTALGRLDKATKSRCLLLMDAPDNTLVLSGCDDRSFKKPAIEHDDGKRFTSYLLDRQTKDDLRVSIVPRDQFVAPSCFAYPVQLPKELQRYPIVILLRPDWLHAVFKRIDRSTEVILEFDRFQQTFAVVTFVDGKEWREKTSISDDHILANPFFKSSQEATKSTNVLMVPNPVLALRDPSPVSNSKLDSIVEEPQTTTDWVNYYKPMSCNIQCSPKSIWVAVKKLTRSSTFVRLYMAPGRPFVLQHILEEVPSNGQQAGDNDSTLSSAYTTWIHPIHNKLQDHLQYNQETMEKMVESMLKRRRSVPGPKEAAQLAINAIKEVAMNKSLVSENKVKTTDPACGANVKKPVLLTVQPVDIEQKSVAMDTTCEAEIECKANPPIAPKGKAKKRKASDNDAESSEKRKRGRPPKKG